jgi:hypothetical protein
MNPSYPPLLPPQVFIDEALSPAELESMCADYESPEELADQLALKFQGALAAAAAAPYVKVF